MNPESPGLEAARHAAAGARRSTRTRLRHLPLLLLLAIAIGLAPGIAAKTTTEVPPERVALLALRILAFDQNLAQRVPGKAVIGVLYPDRTGPDPECAAILEQLQSHSREMTVAGLPGGSVGLPLSQLEKRSAELAALYVCTGLEASLPRITRVARQSKLLTFGNTVDLIGRGVSIAIVVRGNRPRIMLDLEAARAEGVDFDSSLLRVAEIVR